MQVASGFGLSTFLLLPKFLASALGAGGLAIGADAGTYGLASLVVVPLVGAQIDRDGARRPILIGNLLLIVGALGFVLVKEVGPLALVARALHGAAWTMVFNGGMTLATVLAPPGRLAQAMGVYGSANVITMALAPAIAEPLVDVVGWQAVFAGAAALAAVAVALGRGLGEPPPPEIPAPGGLRTLLVRRRTRALLVIVLTAGVALGVIFNFYQP